MAPHRPVSAAQDPSASASASSSVAGESSRLQEAASRWLQTLSEPELDFLISIKELAATQAAAAGHPSLAHRLFHLRTLRALGMVLLEDFKERRKQTSGDGDDANTDIVAFQRLALLGDDHQQIMPNAVARTKRKHIQLGDEEGGPSSVIKTKIDAEVFGDEAGQSTISDSSP